MEIGSGWFEPVLDLHLHTHIWQQCFLEIVNKKYRQHELET
jgi:hypothetical protein